MKKIITVTAVLVMLAAAAFAITGCSGSNRTAQLQDSLQTTYDQLKEEFKDTAKDKKSFDDIRAYVSQ